MTVVYTGDEMRHEQERRASSKARILAALQQAGLSGCSSHQLNAISFRYGARLMELRRAGHDIESIDEGEGRWAYVLHVPARPRAPKPGDQGFLASLPVVASINPRVRVAPAQDDTPPDGLLFPL